MTLKELVSKLPADQAADGDYKIMVPQAKDGKSSTLPYCEATTVTIDETDRTVTIEGSDFN